MSAYIDTAKHKRIIVDGFVGTEGKSGVLYSVNILGINGTAIVTFRNGGATGEILLIVGTPRINEANCFCCNRGLIFNTDIYCEFSGTATTRRCQVEYDEIEK